MSEILEGKTGTLKRNVGGKNMQLNEEIQNAKQDISSALEYFYSQKMMNINTVLPAKIIAIDGVRATVQPLIDTIVFGGEIVPRAEIKDVPVYQLSSKNYSIYVPLAVGDIGFILCTQRDISDFKNTLEQKEPPSKRVLSIADCIFIPMHSFDKNFNPKDETAICIEDSQNGDSIILGNGKLLIETKQCEIKTTEATIDAQVATIKATKVDLGGVGGLGIARIGDAVATPVGPGTITGGSITVFAK